MLFLKQAAGDADGGTHTSVALGESTAIRLEIALLTGDDATRRREIAAAVANDPAFAGWTLRAAEHRTGRTINRAEEAADWLAGNLVIQLAAAIESDGPLAKPSDIEWRLPALLTILAEHERALGSFTARLEHEKLESLKELAYGASHEINNPLANIAARAQTLLDDEDDLERVRKLTAIHRQAMRAHEMISDLMLFARPPKLDPKRIDLRPVVRRIVDEQLEAAEERGVKLSCDVGNEAVEASADETQIAVAISALVRNALEAVPDGGQIWITTRWVEGDGESSVEIAVRDNGPGISDEVRRHLFDPFFSGREAGRGLGFGLSKCWRIVTDHGGRVVVNRPSTGGAEFCILLPALEQLSKVVES